MLAFLICGLVLLAALLGGAGPDLSGDDGRRFRPVASADVVGNL